MIWGHLLEAQLLTAADSITGMGGDVDDLLSVWEGPRLTVGEVLAMEGDRWGLSFPREDDQWVGWLARRGTPSVGAGRVLVLGDGRLGWSLRGGRTIESYGPSLTVVTDPGDGRYTASYRVPGVR